MQHRVPLVLGLLVLSFAGVIFAFDGDPSDSWHRRIPYSGYLEHNGQPLSTPTDIEFALFLTHTPETAVWTETQTVSPASGQFSVVLGDLEANPIPAEVFAERTGVFLGMSIDGVELGQKHRILGSPFSSSVAATPPGMMMPFAGSLNAIPPGWLPCDGAALSRSEYPALYLAIGDAYGGNGTTTFNAPDLRGRFLRGTDNGAGRDLDAASRQASAAGGNTGDNVGTVQADSFQTHLHANALNINESYVAGAAIHPNGNVEFRTGEGGFSDVYQGTPRLSSSISIVNGSPNSGRVGGETRPTNVTVNWLIKY